MTQGMDRKLEKRKWPPTKIAFIGIAAILASSLLYGLLRNPRKLNVETDRITISTVEQGPFQEFIPVRGTVLPLKTVYLDLLNGGRVENVFVEEGSFVEKGDEILQLANADLQLEVMSQEAKLADQMSESRNARLSMEQNQLRSRQDLAEIEFKIQSAKRQFDRYSGLSEKDRIAMISRHEFEKMKDEYEFQLMRRKLRVETQHQDSLLSVLQINRIEHSLEQMQRNMQIVRGSLDNLILRAPISGQLSLLDAEVGETKNSGERLGQVDVLDGFKVRAAIDEHYIARIAKGQRGEFEPTGSDVSFALSVRKVYPEVREGRFEIDMIFNGLEPVGIRRGQTLHIRLELGDLEDAVLLARGGFYQESGGNWVYVLDESGRLASKRPIRLGRQNPRVFEVLEGLKPGEQVVTSSYDNFGDMDMLVLK